MPPRRSSCTAVPPAQCVFAFPQLPLEAVLQIFALLPADQRLRAAEVSRTWRATVALPVLWRRVDLSLEGGVEPPVSRTLLLAAVARAGATLMTLDVPDAVLSVRDMCQALSASGALVEARISTFRFAHLPALLAAAPHVPLLQAGVSCSLQEAGELLAGGPPFERLRLTGLVLSHGRVAWPPALALALPDARWEPGLEHLSLFEANLHRAGALDALVDVVVARHSNLHRLTLADCDLPPATAAALARALRDGALTYLSFIGTFLDASGAMELGEALRGNSTLTSLSLSQLGLPAAPAVAALLGSLVGHNSLRELELCCTPLADAAAALAALVAADAPALQFLVVERCRLGEAGLGPLCDALPRNSHLRFLNVANNSLPAGFVRARLLPAVRANVSLRTLVAIRDDLHAGVNDQIDYDFDDDDAIYADNYEAAEELVAER